MLTLLAHGLACHVPHEHLVGLQSWRRQHGNSKNGEGETIEIDEERLESCAHQCCRPM